MAELIRMMAPNGSSVRVARGRVEALLAAGYSKAESPKKATESKPKKK